MILFAGAHAHCIYLLSLPWVHTQLEQHADSESVFSYVTVRTSSRFIFLGPARKLYRLGWACFALLLPGWRFKVSLRHTGVASVSFLLLCLSVSVSLHLKKSGQSGRALVTTKYNFNSTFVNVSPQCYFFFFFLFFGQVCIKDCSLQNQYGHFPASSPPLLLSCLF